MERYGLSDGSDFLVPVFVPQDFSTVSIKLWNYFYGITSMDYSNERLFQIITHGPSTSTKYFLNRNSEHIPRPDFIATGKLKNIRLRVVYPYGPIDPLSRR